MCEVTIFVSLMFGNICKYMLKPIVGTNKRHRGLDALLGHMADRNTLGLYLNAM